MTSLALPDGPLNVACLAAHPDDLEIAAGATILELAARPSTSITSLTLTGTPERRKEAEAAAQAFAPGSDAWFRELPDGRLPAHWGEVKDLLEEYAAAVVRPDLVLAPRADDAHQDHRLLGRLAPTVWRSALILHYEIPKWDGDLGRPNTYVAVDEDAARHKVDLLDECYPSQRHRDWWDSELFLGFMRVRGMECRSRYAEAFSTFKTTLSLTPSG